MKNQKKEKKETYGMWKKINSKKELIDVSPIVNLLQLPDNIPILSIAVTKNAIQHYKLVYLNNYEDTRLIPKHDAKKHHSSDTDMRKLACCATKIFDDTLWTPMIHYGQDYQAYVKRWASTMVTDVHFINLKTGDYVKLKLRKKYIKKHMKLWVARIGKEINYERI